MNRPSYYAILPAGVRYDAKLSASAKLIYAEITARMGQDGICWDTNQVFMDLHQASERAVRGWISELCDFDHLFVREFRTAAGSTRALSASKAAIMACEPPQSPRQIPAGGGGLARAGDIKGNNILCHSANAVIQPAVSNTGSEAGLFTEPITESSKQDTTALYAKILNDYRAICVPAGLPDVRVLSDARKAAIRARLKEVGGDTESFVNLFKRAAASLFLTGKNPGQKWSADFDFLFTPGGFTKVLEGKYDNKAAPAATSQTEEL